MKSSSRIRVSAAIVTIGIAIASSAGAGIGATKPPDFWNYDPITGQKVSNSSPSVAPEHLAGLLFGLGNTVGPSRADEVRAAALNSRYGNVWTRVSPAVFRTLVSSFGAEVTVTMTPQQARAELARGSGLNRLAEQYAATAKPISTTVPSTAKAEAQAVPTQDPTAEMERHFDHEDALYHPSNSTSAARLVSASKFPVNGGFDWTDALVGAGAAAAVMLFGAAASVGIRRRRSTLAHS